MMDPQSNNSHAGHVAGTYPLSRLTRPLPSLAGLQAFATAAQCGSLSKAADRLCRTQGAISRQIQQLEAHYGCALFTRSAFGLTLTRQGEALRATALQVLGLLIEQERALNASASTLALRVPSTFCVRWLLPRLQAIRERLADTDLKILTSSDDMPDFNGRDIDAMIVRGAGEWPGLESILLFKEMLVPMCAPALASSLGSVRDLGSAALLHAGAGGAEWNWWLQHNGAGGIDTASGLVFDTLDLSLAAAAAGHGIAIGDPRMAADRLERGELVIPFSVPVENRMAYFLTFPLQAAGNPVFRTLADQLVRLAEEDVRHADKP